MFLDADALQFSSCYIQYIQNYRRDLTCNTINDSPWNDTSMRHNNVQESEACKNIKGPFVIDAVEFSG